MGNKKIDEFIMRAGPFKGKRIVSAPDDQVVELDSECQQVLEALGHPEAYITDLSALSDFCVDEIEAQEMSVELGVEISRSDLIVEVARRVSDKRKSIN